MGGGGGYRAQVEVRDIIRQSGSKTRVGGAYTDTIGRAAECARCYALLCALLRVVTRCYARCYALLCVVMRVVTRCYALLCALLRVVTRCYARCYAFLV